MAASNCNDTYLHTLPPDILGTIDKQTSFKIFLLHIDLNLPGEDPCRNIFVKAHNKDDVLKEFIHCDKEGIITLIINVIHQRYIGCTGTYENSDDEDFFGEIFEEFEEEYGEAIKPLNQLHSLKGNLFSESGIPDLENEEEMETYFAFLKENEEDILKILAKSSNYIDIVEVIPYKRMF